MVYSHLLKIPLYYVAAFVGRVRFGRELDKIWGFSFTYVCISFLNKFMEIKIIYDCAFSYFYSKLSNSD